MSQSAAIIWEDDRIVQNIINNQSTKKKKIMSKKKIDKSDIFRDISEAVSGIDQRKMGSQSFTSTWQDDQKVDEIIKDQEKKKRDK